MNLLYLCNEKLVYGERIALQGYCYFFILLSNEIVCSKFLERSETKCIL